jgi:hypothetical protein
MHQIRIRGSNNCIDPIIKLYIYIIIYSLELGITDVCSEVMRDVMVDVVEGEGGCGGGELHIGVGLLVRP